ncbi:hypothetical protein AAVH_04908 [Aphelenchoides avenae]|nr:hypothetical protein AAVH_04908 [Aphelenchus avenae]
MDNNNNENKSSLDAIRSSMMGMVQFHVGGKVFQTNAQAFKRTEPNCEWTRIADERPSSAYKIECDPDVFSAILYYLHTGHLHVDRERIHLGELFRLAERTHMDGLAKKVKQLSQMNRMDVVRIHFPSPQVITISANKDGMQNALLRKLQMTYPSATFDVSTGNIPIAVLTIDLSAKDADAVATLLNDCGATLDMLGYALTYQKVNAEGVVYDFSRTS